jgi:hypothetical protein
MRQTSRKDLIDIFQNQSIGNLGGVRQVDLLAPALDRPQELLLLWQCEPCQRPSLPSAVVVEQDARRDFLAWTATYLPTFRPFTAYFRVLDVATAEALMKPDSTPFLGTLEPACLGLIFGEAATYLEERHDLRQLTPIGCAGTYSYCMSRALSLGLGNQTPDAVAKAWSTVRNITRQAPLTPDVSCLQDVWSVLLSLTEDTQFSVSQTWRRMPDEIVSACLDVSRLGELQPNTWRALVRHQVPMLAPMMAEMRGTREERVSLLEAVLKNMSAELGDFATGSFISAYLVSLVAPGTMDHVGLLGPHLRALPTAILWYGLLAGLHKESGLQSFASGLGRRVMREVLRDERLLDRPHCDISSAELEILMGSEKQVLDFRTASQSHIEVELAPCITTVVRWRPRNSAQTELFPMRPPEPGSTEVLTELDAALSKFVAIRQKLVKLLGIRNQPDSHGREDKRGRRTR